MANISFYMDIQVFLMTHLLIYHHTFRHVQTRKKHLQFIASALFSVNFKSNGSQD